MLKLSTQDITYTNGKVLSIKQKMIHITYLYQI